MSAPARDALRRGWCPSTLRPMETADGWLVRLHPPGRRLSPHQLARIATLAQEHGNGLVEISARANLQLRGVTPQSHPLLVEALLAERLVDEREGDGPQRVTLVSPLAGSTSLPPPACGGEGWGGAPESQSSVLDRFAERSCSPPQAGGGRTPFIDAGALAEAIEAAARGIGGLPPKFGVVVDDGGPSSLDGFDGDIRLVGTAPGALVLRLADGGWLGPLAEHDAAGLVATIMRRFAQLRRDNPALRRMRDLAPDHRDGLVALDIAAPVPARPAPRRVGLFDKGAENVAAAIGLPFGRCAAMVLDALARAASGALVTIRPSPWRCLVFSGLSAERADALLGTAVAAGLITRDDDPRLSIQACAGSPACGRGEAPAAADAERLALALPALLRETSLHVSGCLKGCAHPGPAALTLVGQGGRYGVVIDGRSDDAPVAVLDLPALTARLQPGGDWRARFAMRETGQDR